MNDKESNLRKTFKIVKESGDVIYVSELRRPVYECSVPNDASTYYRTKKEVDEMNEDPIYFKQVRILHPDDPFYWVSHFIGYARSLQDIYHCAKLMRDEIVSMTRVNDEDVDKLLYEALNGVE